MEELTDQGSKKCDTIVLTGKQENCDMAKEALQVGPSYREIHTENICTKPIPGLSQS